MILFFSNIAILIFNLYTRSEWKEIVRTYYRHVLGNEEIKNWSSNLFSKNYCNRIKMYNSDKQSATPPEKYENNRLKYYN